MKQVDLRGLTSKDALSILDKAKIKVGSLFWATIDDDWSGDKLPIIQPCIRHKKNSFRVLTHDTKAFNKAFGIKN